MENIFKNLVEKFENIKGLGYVKSINDKYNGVGLTFESLLGKSQDDFAYPDYEGIEIKTHRKFSKYPITLFGASLWGPTFPENDRIRSTYGYYQTDAPDDRKIVTEFYGNKKVLVCNRYFFNLEVNKEEEKLYLVISDFNHNLIEKEAYWEFSELKEKLECKLKHLAIVLAKEQNQNRCDYYNYVELYCYVLKDFETFLQLIEKNIISVSMTCSATKFGPSIGKQKLSCYFRIGIFDLPKLFTLDYKVGGDTDRYLK